MKKVTLEVVNEVTEYYELEIDETKYNSLDELVDEIKNKNTRSKFQDYDEDGTLEYQGEYDDRVVTLKRIVLAEENDSDAPCPICGEDDCYCDGDGVDVEKYDVIITQA